MSLHAMIAVRDSRDSMTMSGASVLVDLALHPPPGWELTFMFQPDVSPVEAARNRIADLFLTHTTASHLVMIGSDNKFNGTIRHLFENPELDVVGAPYLTWQGHRPPGEEIILVGAPLSGWADEGLTPARYVGMDCTRTRREVIEQILISLFAGGHCLITGAPGLAKTLFVKSSARIFHLRFQRIQFTPTSCPPISPA